MSDEEAVKAAKDLVEWARNRWGVELETKYLCPNDDYTAEYEGYCPNDGRKLKKAQVESDRQDWQYNLDMFISLPEYPEPPNKEQL